MVWFQVLNRKMFLLYFLSVFQWHPLLVSVGEAVARASGRSFNSLLCNLYRDGHDSIGWHSDDEASLGAEPIIASLSLGDTRVFSLRKKPPPVRKWSGSCDSLCRTLICVGHVTLVWSVCGPGGGRRLHPRGTDPGSFESRNAAAHVRSHTG